MGEVQAQKLISVIIPVFNVAPYLKRCIDSVINQSYKHLEIILVDDGSTDDSGIICDQYKDIDSRIQVFHTENKGLSEARNYGFEVCHGGYILYIDSDDYIGEDYVGVLYKSIVETGVGFVQSGFVCVDSKYLTKKKVGKDEKIKVVISAEEYMKKVLKGETPVAVWGRLFERRIIDKIKNPPGRLYEDHMVVCKYTKMCDYVCIENNATYYHVTDREGAITTTISEKTLRDLILAHNVLIRDCVRLFPLLRDETIESHKSRVISFWAKIIKNTSIVYLLFPFLLKRENRFVLLGYLEVAKKYILFHFKDYMQMSNKRKLQAISICYAPWVYTAYIKLRNMHI